MNLRDCIPAHKDDLAAVQKAGRAGYPALGDALGDLLPWIKDPTWPVAEQLVPLLARAGPEIAPHLMAVFASQEEDLKQAIMITLAPRLSLPARALITPELQRIARQPTSGEQGAAVDEAAKLVLAAWDT